MIICKIMLQFVTIYVIFNNMLLALWPDPRRIPTGFLLANNR